MSIYIPIWLDYEFDPSISQQDTLTRFTFQYGQIMNHHFRVFGCDNNYAFTFQYGQIMNDLEDLRGSICLAFTFQYGQIMN